MNEDKKVTVIINNRDLLDWPRKMVERLESMLGVYEIILLDNGSTYKPLLNWYKNINHKVIFLDNLGHRAPWISGVIDKIETDYYVVSDPDLDLSGVPDDAIFGLIEILDSNPELGKVGLGLETEGIPEDSPYYQHVLNYEKFVQDKNTDHQGLISMPVDTTFAVYDRRVLNEYKICGVRTAKPYLAKHEPWYIVQPSGDFAYYLDHAEGDSSSYRGFVKYVVSDSVRGLYEAYKLSTNNKVSTKWDSYLDVYEELLFNFKRKSINLLEIGVQNGGSLEIWSQYFKNAKKIIGCDINPRCQGLKYEDSRVEVHVGNANELNVFNSIRVSSSHFDVIIDDGSHTSHDVISSFINYFPLLNDDGVYIVEDMHCAFWENYGGGVLNERSSASFFRKLFDAVNMDHFKEIDAGSLFQAFFGREFMNNFLKDNQILSVSAYDSIFVIKKSSSSRPRGLGKEVIVGDVAIADDRVLSKKFIN